MNTKTSLRIFTVSLAIITVASAVYIQPTVESKGNGLVDLLNVINNHHELAVKSDSSLSRTTWNAFWERVRGYAKDKNLNGLVSYLSVIPETTTVLDWLKQYYPQVWYAVCPLFDACTDDVYIPPEVIQKILRYIYLNDWDGLVTYLKTLEEFDALCEWIKDNFPAAWQEICQLVEKQC